MHQPLLDVKIYDTDERPFLELSIRGLVQSICTHLTAPASTTLKAYQLVATTMAKRLQSDGIVLAREYFLDRFPEIQLKAWRDDLDAKQSLLWGRVDKGETDNRIYIRKNVVEAYERACAETLESKWTLSLLLLVIILHEVTHAMTKDLFSGTVTPSGYDSDSPIPSREVEELDLNGESGWVIEDQVFGFRLLVEWKSKDRGNMDKILRLIAKGPDNGTRVIGPQDARKVVESLGGSTLYKIDFQALQPAPDVDAEVFRARGSLSNNGLIRESVSLSDEKSIYHSIIRCGIRPQARTSMESDSLVPTLPLMTRDEVTGGDRLLASVAGTDREDSMG